MAEKEVGEVKVKVKIAGERRVRETRTHKRVSQKITSVPRDCDTLTHLKKVSPRREDAHLEQYPALMFDGSLGLLKVRIKFLVGKSDESFFYLNSSDLSDTLVRKTFQISVLDAHKRSDSEMTPREEFKVLRGVTTSGESINVLASKKDLLCTADIVSISRSPDRSFLMDLGSPPIPIKAL
ncbi:hypothetical protein TNCV_3919601 [Trichonephila clavipes]|nr:hypothetical protein TNCV_3919601 [Trichonephila clavipes]